MKKLLNIISIVLIPIYILMAIVLYLLEIGNNLLGLPGEISSLLSQIGLFVAPVGIICIILGYVIRRKEDNLMSRVLPFVGLIMALILFGGIVVCEFADSYYRDEQDVLADIEIYGEDWNAPCLIEDIPGYYKDILDKRYVILKEQWDTEKLQDYGIFSWMMPEFYGNNALENIGFKIIDINGDGTDELLIGTVNHKQDYENLIFDIYIDPSNPYPIYSAYDNSYTYLHKQDDNTYLVENIVIGEDGTIESCTEKIMAGIDESDGYTEELDIVVESESRADMNLIPFSKYR